MKFPGLILRHDCVNCSAHFEELCEEELEMLLSHPNNVNPLRTVLFTYTNWCKVLREVYLDKVSINRKTGKHLVSKAFVSWEKPVSLLLQSTFPASLDTPTYLPPEFQTELWIYHLQSMLQIKQA